MGFNKGEWSEIYTFLYLLENPDIKIVNNEFKEKLFQTYQDYLNRINILVTGSNGQLEKLRNIYYLIFLQIGEFYYLKFYLKKLLQVLLILLICKV